MTDTTADLVERLREGARDLHPYCLDEVDSPHLNVALPAYLNEAADRIEANAQGEAVGWVSEWTGHMGHLCRAYHPDKHEAADNAKWMHGRSYAVHEALAAQPSAGAQGEVDMAFGFGRFVVDTGCYQQKPAVFICPVDQPGEIGASARHLGHDRHKLLPGERVLTFPTVDQAQSVADALVGSPTTPAQPDTGDVAALREALTECQRVFADYAEMHRHKLTQILTTAQRQDVHRKINRNRDMSDMCLAALSKPNASGAR